LVLVRLENAIWLVLDLDLAHTENGVNRCVMMLVPLKKGNAPITDTATLLCPTKVMEYGQ